MSENFANRSLAQLKTSLQSALPSALAVGERWMQKLEDERIEATVAQLVPKPIQDWTLRFGVLPLLSQTSTWTKGHSFLDRELQLIIDLISSVSDQEANERVHKTGVLGLDLEAQSWSIAETIEHLILAHSLMHRILEALVQENSPNIRIDLQALKPQGGIKWSRLKTQFLEHAETWRSKSRQRSLTYRRLGKDDFTSRAKCIDPILGELSSIEWHWYQGLHVSIHRRQIRAITKSLNSVRKTV